MNQGIRTILYPVKDIAQAKKMFNKLLGVQPIVDQPYYVGYQVGGQDIGLDPNGFKQGMTGPLAYYHVDDIKQSLQDILDAGGLIQAAVRDVGGGKLAAAVRDPDGNSIGLIQMP
jgi:predicted enzyme related to lactoylglutathione lyase